MTPTLPRKIPPAPEPPPVPAPASHGSIWQDLQELPRPFWILFSGTFINRFGTFVMPFLAIWLVREGYSMQQAGIAISCYGAGALAASVAGGHLADTVGRRLTMAAGSWGAAACLIALYYSRGLPMILSIAALNGFFNALYAPAANALIADLVPERLRVRAYGAMRFAINAGFGIGSGAAGFLAKYSFAWLFFGDAFTLLIFGAITAAFLPHGVRHQRGLAGYVPWSTALRQIFRDRAFVAMFVSAILSALIFTQFNTSFGLEVARRGFDTTVYGTLLSMNGLMVILFELPLTTLTLRYPPRKVMAFGYLLLGGGFALNAMGSHLSVLYGAMAIFTVGEMIAMPTQSAYVAQLAPSHLRGRYSGAMSMAWSGAAMIGPAGGMWIFSRQPSTLWACCGILGVLAALVMLTYTAGAKSGKSLAAS